MFAGCFHESFFKMLSRKDLISEPESAACHLSRRSYSIALVHSDAISADLELHSSFCSFHLSQSTDYKRWRLDFIPQRKKSMASFVAFDSIVS